MSTFGQAKNDLLTALGSAYTAGSGTMTLATGGGASWPTPSPTAPVRFTVITAASFRTAGEVKTIFEATGRAGDVLSGVAAVEGTTDRNYDAGAWAEHRPTFKFVDEIQDAVLVLEGHTGGVIGGTLSGGTAGRVLFVAAGPVLAGSSHLTFDDATETLTLGASIATGAGTLAGFGDLDLSVGAGQSVFAKVNAATVLTVSAAGVAIVGTASTTGAATVGGQLTVSGRHVSTYANSDYTNTGGAGSALKFENSGTQTVVYYEFGGTMRGKSRLDSAGNQSWIVNGGEHAFYTGGDYGAGTPRLGIRNSGRIGVNVNSFDGTGTSNVEPDSTFEVHSLDVALTAVIIKALASQTANLQEWRSGTSAVLSTITENGYFTTRKTAAPADAELVAGELALWFDATNGAAKAKFKGKSADGTVVAGEVALA